MVLALVVILVLGLTALVVWIGAGDVIRDRLSSRGQMSEMSLPPLLFPLAPADGEPAVTPAPIGFAPRPAPPAPAVPVAAPAMAAPVAGASSNGSGTRYESAFSVAPGSTRHERPARTAPPIVNETLARAGLTVVHETDGLEDEDGDAKTIVFHRPSDEPLQLLPGRFEVVSGEPEREDIRFAGALGEPAEIVLGREGGPSKRRIRLHSPTVSRRHALMSFRDGRWMITNLSATNPVIVNEEVLSPAHGETRVLVEGDQVELGEVVLRFRAR